MQGKESLNQEQRHYIRLDSVFPVEFRILTADGKGFLSDWLQGFTNNVSKGGLCLEVNNLSPELAQALKAEGARLSLGIEMPVSKSPVGARAGVVWVKETSSELHKYLIGLNYEEIDPQQNQRIMRYALVKRLFIPLVLTAVFIFGSGLAINSYFNIRLIQGNKALVAQLVNTLQESRLAQEKMQDINREREDLLSRMQKLQLDIKKVEEEKAELGNKVAQEEKARLQEAESNQRITELSASIDKLTQDKASLQEQLAALQKKESAVTEEMSRLGQKKATLEKANFDRMYRWLQIHQNPRTGLVMSFEGDEDIANWAFIYDQSLVIQAFTLFSDFERARKILDFFSKRAKRSGQEFYNAYYASDGNPVEYTLHSGPNIWLGIAIMQYSKKTGDQNYLGLAEEIAQAVINLQNQDKEGGIRGGPGVGWYATEHNLDAYAFFDMLYKFTARRKYMEARDRVLNWLLQHTYDKSQVPIKRGKGDSTIATDTYAWSIAAIGPEKLESLGMSPEKIMDFAEQNCSIETLYTRPEGQSVKVRGFDFAPQRNLARGGVVSSEWTAQMVLAFKIMANFYAKKGLLPKAEAYTEKANAYLAELGKMIISSPSPSGQGESCLPYATQDFVDTGHGWMTPKGNSTGSVSGTTYTLFAYYNYNPLEFRQ